MSVNQDLPHRSPTAAANDVSLEHAPPERPFAASTPAPAVAHVGPGADLSRVDAVYEWLLLRIVRGELPGGSELKSTRIAASLGLSRTPVVQALQRLAADGLVSLEPNKRAVVRPGAENWLVEIHALRELLEPFAAQLAAVRIAADELAALQALAQAARPDRLAPDSHTWQAAAQRFDFELHRRVAEASGNLALVAAIRKCWSYKRVSYLAATEPSENLAQGYQEHLAILAALEQHDGARASAAMLLHLRSAARLRPAQTIV